MALGAPLAARPAPGCPPICLRSKPPKKSLPRCHGLPLCAPRSSRRPIHPPSLRIASPRPPGNDSRAGTWQGYDQGPLSLRNIMQQLAAAAGVCGDWKMKRVRVDTCLAVPYTKETRYGTRTLEGVISPGKVLRQSPVLEAGSLFSISKLWQCSSGRSCMTGPLAGPATRRIGLKACII